MTTRAVFAGHWMYRMLRTVTVEAMGGKRRTVSGSAWLRYILRYLGMDYWLVWS